MRAAVPDKATAKMAREIREKAGLGKPKPVEYRLYVEQDECAESPESWEDPGAWIVTTRNRHFEVVPEGWSVERAALVARGLCETCKGEDTGEGAPCAACGGENPDADDRKLRAFPLYAYVHSGVALSMGREGQFSDRWDSGQIGFVVEDPAELNPEAKPGEAAQGIVETWNQYLSGDVWAYRVTHVERCNLGHEHEETVDSCGGFYGEEYARGEAEAALAACKRAAKRKGARSE